MSKIYENIRSLLVEYKPGQKIKSSDPFGMRLAKALQWNSGVARTEQLANLGMSGEVTRTFVGDQPAAIFVGGSHLKSRDLLGDAALYAYHASIEWGMVIDSIEAIIFNSHWIRNGYWFNLPPIRWGRLKTQIGVLEALTPQGLTEGRIEKIASSFYEPDQQLVPVDDALVDRLDHWRDETMRHVKQFIEIDEKLHTLFAQLFVLRTVEDRRLTPMLPSLWSTFNSHNEVDLSKLREIFEGAKKYIQSELFDIIEFDNLPSFILSGIIKDLYIPSQLPISDAKYNFAWIDADILGRAYEKYISTLLIPSSLPPQLSLWQQPLREVERVSVRKASGVYYTPSFLVRYITERCFNYYFQEIEDPIKNIPKVADISCGSGSFLTAAVDSLIRRYKSIDASRDWGRVLVKNKCINGLDIDPRAVTFARLSLWLRLAEEPKPLPLPSLRGNIVCGDSLRPETWTNLPNKYSAILGNPPFLASGNVSSKTALSLRFKTAQGRFDYSYLFVEQALTKLKEGGCLGLVIPNRLFRNKDASIIRDILSSETELFNIIDFGSTEIFSGTNTYTGALIARKGKSDSPVQSVRFIQVSKLPNRFIGATLSQADQKGPEIKNQFIAAYDAQEPHGPHPWILLSASAKRARIILESKSDLLSSIAGIFQGIRTGANDIFIVELESPVSGTVVQVRNGLGDVHLVETSILRPVIFGSDIQRYDIVRPTRFLIYPHLSNKPISEVTLRKEFPSTYKYLSTYRDLLASRTSTIASGQSWYELVRKRDETWLNKKKLLIRDLATETSFALDDSGSTYLVGGTAIVPDNPDLLLPLLVYLNSSVVTWMLNQITPSFRAGFQKFEPQHLQRVPVPLDIIGNEEICDTLSNLAHSIILAKQSGGWSVQQNYEDEANRLLCSFIGIDEKDLQ